MKKVQLIFLFGGASGNKTAEKYMDIWHDLLSHVMGVGLLIINSRNTVETPSELLNEFIGDLTKHKEKSRTLPFVIFCGENFYSIKDSLPCPKINGHTLMHALLELSGGNYETEKEAEIPRGLFVHGVEYTLRHFPTLNKETVDKKLRAIYSQEGTETDAQMFRDLYIGGTRLLLQNEY